MSENFHDGAVHGPNKIPLDFIDTTPIVECDYSKLKKPAHAATPLRLVNLSGEVPKNTKPSVLETSYMLYAFDTLHERLESRLTELTRQGKRPSDEVIVMTEASMMAALSRRIEQNSRKVLPTNLDNNPTYLRANVGLASPLELFDFLLDYPKIGAIEAAKLTCPFSWDTSEMDTEVFEALKNCGAEQINEEPRYYIVRVDDVARPNAAVVIRKHPICSIPARQKDDRDSLITVTQRDSFVIDLNTSGMSPIKKELHDEILADSQIRKNLGAGKARIDILTYVAQYIDEQLQLPIADREDSLQMVARSYYGSNTVDIETRHRHPAYELDEDIKRRIEALRAEYRSGSIDLPHNSD